MILYVDLSQLSYFQQDDYYIYVKAVGPAGTSSASNIFEYDNRTQLDAPTNVSISNNVVSFDAVTNATRYLLLADSTHIGYYTSSDTGTLSVNVTTLNEYHNVSAGQHNLTVKALSDDYKTSEASTAITFTKFTAPSNESITNDTYEFDEVTHAEMYDVYATISGVDTYIGTYYTNDYTYTFENGVLTIYSAPYTVSNGNITIN